MGLCVAAIVLIDNVTCFRADDAWFRDAFGPPESSWSTFEFSGHVLLSLDLLVLGLQMTYAMPGVDAPGGTNSLPPAGHGACAQRRESQSGAFLYSFTPSCLVCSRVHAWTRFECSRDALQEGLISFAALCCGKDPLSDAMS